MSSDPKPLWTCPKCGQRFIRRNTNHSCGRYDLDRHFAGKDPIVRAVFDRYVEVVRAFGPVDVVPLKTRIVFRARSNFAAAVARKRTLEGILWLKRHAAHPRIYRLEMQVYRDYGHYFRLTRPDDLDDELVALLQEAYVIASLA
jgi:hypothetical protein